MIRRGRRFEHAAQDSCARIVVVMTALRKFHDAVISVRGKAVAISADRP
jgi:hypothetical protein